MVMSIKEEITALEEQLENTKGPGSKAKKADIQAKIDALKKEDTPTVSEAEKEEEYKEENLKEDQDVAKKEGYNRDKKIAEEKLKQFPGRLLPPGKEWIKVTPKQLQEAQNDGTLMGYDDKNCTALIRGK